MPLLPDTHEALVSLKGNRGVLHITLVDISKFVKFTKYLSNEISHTHGALHYKRWSTHHLEETVVVERM